VLAGLWVILYGLAEVLPRYGVRALDEILFSSSRIQGSISGAITDWGTPLLVTVLSLVAAAVAAVFVLARRDAKRTQPATTAPALEPGAVETGAAGTHDAPAQATQDVLDAIRRATTRR